jgi:hypothetical protein
VALVDWPGGTVFRVTLNVVNGTLDGVLSFGAFDGLFTEGIQGQTIIGLVDQVPAPPDPVPNQQNSIIYVGPGGDDASGQRGNVLQAFREISAALGAAQNGDAIEAAPGDYGPVIIRAGLDNVTIKGMGNRESVRILDAGDNALRWLPAGSERLYLENLTLASFSPGFAALDANGLASPTNAAELECRNVASAGGAGARGIHAENLSSVRHIGGMGSAEHLDCNGSLAVGYQGELHYALTDPTPARVFQLDNVVKGCQLDRLLQAGGASVQADSACDISQWDTGLTPLGPDAAVRCAGECRVATLLLGPNAIPVSFEGSRNCALSVIYAGAVDHSVNCKGATLTSITSTTLTNALSFDNKGGTCGLAGSSFDANSYLDRDGCGADNVAIPALGAVLAFGVDLPGPPYPPGVAVSYVVSSQDPPAVISDVLTVGLQSNAGCAVNNGASPQDASLQWARVPD